MHLYRSIPEVKTSKPVKITENTYFSDNLHNNNYLRIDTVAVLTLTPGLDPEFYCKIRVFQGGQLRVIAENCICRGVEGVFVEENQTCEIIRLDNGDFELIRDRPVDVGDYIELYRSSVSHGSLSSPSFVDTKMRIMNGGAILVDKNIKLTQDITINSSVENPNLDLLSFYSTNNKLNHWGSFKHISEVDFNLWDFTVASFAACSIFNCVGVNGIDKLPNNSDIAVHTCSSFVGQLFFSQYNTANVIIKSASHSNFIESIEYVSDGLPDVTRYELNNFVLGNRVNLRFRNLPLLDEIFMYQNKTDNCVDIVEITNCPNLLTINIINFNARNGTQFAADKNYDQLLIDLDNNGLSNGVIILSEDFVRTAVSDAAKASLEAKFWDLTGIRVRL